MGCKKPRLSKTLVKKETKQVKRVRKIKNILLLPTEKSLEQIIANFLNDLDDTNVLWGNINHVYGHQNCFRDYSNEDIQDDRHKAKKWFNLQLPSWGKNASKVLNPWKKQNKELVDEFLSSFDELHQKF